MLKFFNIKKCFFALLSVGAFLAANMSFAADNNCLKIDDRPMQLRLAIGEKFSKLVNAGKSNWSYNGATKYKITGLDDDEVAKRMVDAHPDQKVFNFMDIGAGDHSWAQARVNFLNKEFAHRDVHFNIFSLTGDNYNEKKGDLSIKVDQKEEGKCSLYNLSTFPLENLNEKLKELGYFEMLSHHVDLMVSAFTLMHLVDPIGTFLQMHDLLRPGQGLVFVENMFRQGGHDNGLVEEFFAHTSMLEFLIRYSSNGFVVRRSDDNKTGQWFYQYKVDESYNVECPRAQLNAVKHNQENNPKNILKGHRKDSGSESLRSWLPFKIENE